ncbi:hypothetical protein ACQ4PT_020222 [Festuca glaucescens]
MSGWGKDDRFLDLPVRNWTAHQKDRENIAKMVRCCKESNPLSRTLVFEYPPNGTLYEHLHVREGRKISYLRRLKIVLIITHVLRQFHTEPQPPFAVAALMSSSVYLTEDLAPKIIDFERCRVLIAKPFLRSGVVVNDRPLNCLQI